MTARTRVEAADAVVSVQAEGVDQATKKIKEVDKALGGLPGAAKAADAAAADSSKRWQELAGKVGAAVGAFAAVQGLQLDTTQGLMGLAGVAATATAALGPLGLAVTAAATGVKLLSDALAEAPVYAEQAADGWKKAAIAADEAKAQTDALSRVTGDYLSTLTGPDAVEAIQADGRLRDMQAERLDLVKRRTEAAIDAERAAKEEGRELSRRAIADYTAEYDGKLRALDIERQALERRLETLRNVATGAAVAAGIETEATKKREETIDRIEEARAAKMRAAAAQTALAEAAERERQVNFLLQAGEALEAEHARQQEQSREHGIAMFQLNQDARKRESGAMLKFFQGTHEAEKKRAEQTIALAEAERDAKLAASAAVAGALSATAATLGLAAEIQFGLQGIEYAILASGAAAKAYGAFAIGNFWSGAQFTAQAVQAAATSAMAFRAAGKGGGESAPAIPSGAGGGTAAFSAPPSAAPAGEAGPTTINVSFDRAQRPLTRGDERAIYAGVSRALSGPGGARGLGSRRVAS